MEILHTLNQEELSFPPVELALSEPNGLLAVGGDLSVERLLLAYRQGIFPWYEDGQPILWWHPDPRMVLFPDELHVSSSLNRFIKKQHHTITSDKAFSEVVRACASQRSKNRHGTWITPEMQAAYQHLHETGWAHSVEVWQGEQLIGGLYGIAIGAMFFGESMFSQADNASKLAFVTLVRKLHEQDYKLIDCQVASGHLSSLGAREISRQAFMRVVEEAVDLPRVWPWKNAG
jgi:leucyl/phenylalanyl-tRNA--protein transferase